MPYLITYILKLSISLAVVFAVYWFFLRLLTFYKWNRYFLVLYPLTAFVSPFIDINGLIHRNGLQQSTVVTFIPTIPFLTEETSISETATTNYWMIVCAVLITGILLMAGKLVLQYLSFKKIRKSAVLLYDAGMKLYHVEKKIMPFSFGDSIYVNQHLHQQKELNEIIRHEFIHVKEKHSIDIIFSELLCILNWYNPFAWLIRHAIRQNLEFIADNAVVKNGIDKKEYQYLLLKVTGSSDFSIASNFNFSSLKKRIVMMNKQKSGLVNLFRFLLILPVACIILLAFRGTRFAASEKTLNENSDTASIALHREDGMNAESKVFFERNPNIRLVHWNFTKNELSLYFEGETIKTYSLHDPKEMRNVEKAYGKLPLRSYGSYSLKKSLVSIDTIPTRRAAPRLPSHVRSIHIEDEEATVRLKNGDFERYDLAVRKERNAFQEKYGSVPEAPLYPSIAVEAPSVTMEEIPSIVDARPEPPNPPTAPKLPSNVRSLNIVDAGATVHLKNGDIERYDLTDEDEKIEFKKKYGPILYWKGKETYNLEDAYKVKKAEAKYGKLPVPPPAPPAPPATPAPPRVQWEAVVSGEPVVARRVSNESMIAAQNIVATSKGGYAQISANRNVVKADTIYFSGDQMVIAQGGSQINRVNAVTAPTNKIVISGERVALARSTGDGLETDNDFNVILEISKNTNRERLEQMKSSLQEKGYILKFDNINYHDGKLTALSATISKGKIKSSFNATDFGKLVISVDNRKDGKEGFHIYVYNGNLAL